MDSTHGKGLEEHIPSMPERAAKSMRFRIAALTPPLLAFSLCLLTFTFFIL
jgi:hypothetical protein